MKFHDPPTVGAVPYADDIGPDLERLGLVPWSDLAREFAGLTIRRMTPGLSAKDLSALETLAEQETPGFEALDWSRCFHVTAAPGADLEALAARLRAFPSVELAYIDVGVDLPVWAAPPPPSTPDPDAALQWHLGPAPIGVDATFARTVPGGYGKGQWFVDLEFGWKLDHEDLVARGIEMLPHVLPSSGVEPDAGRNHPAYRDHGTQVLGVVSATLANGVGGNGIAPHTSWHRTVSCFPESGDANLRQGILAATAHLAAHAAPKTPRGAVLLLEIQLPATSTRPALPAEADWFNFWAIRQATASGIVVVEPAGNGGVDLDEWMPPIRPFDDPVRPLEDPTRLLDDPTRRRLLVLAERLRRVRDSGAILVAGTTPGTYGSPGTPAVPNTRHPSSNYGSRVDCHGPASFVWTTAFVPSNVEGGLPQLYTDSFNGTSSSSAVVAGVVLVMQGIVERAGLPRLPPSKVRHLLRIRGLGTEPGGGASEKIGVQPDLRKLILAGAELWPSLAGTQTAAPESATASDGSAVIPTAERAPAPRLNSAAPSR